MRKRLHVVLTAVIIGTVLTASGCRKKDSTPNLSVAEYQTAVREGILNLSSYVSEESDSLAGLSDTMEKIKSEMETMENLSAPTQCKKYDEDLKKICAEYIEISDYLIDLSSLSKDELTEKMDKYSDELYTKETRLQELQVSLQDTVENIFSVDTGETVSSTKEEKD